MPQSAFLIAAAESNHTHLSVAGSRTITYRNPVIPGFFPDPSVVRVGLDYYVVHSTFQYFPAIAISHSRDLIHWTQIGHVFDARNPLLLTHFFDGCGIWAPDISYHDGWFHIFFCLVQLSKDRSVNVRGNYGVRARSITGPFSEPVQFTSVGNDPSHFVDKDGSHYLVYAAGLPLGRGTKIVKLNEDCTHTIGDTKWMEWGIDRRAPEGPHIFRRGEYYYHTMAAGSGRFDGHHQLMARSKSLLGPYEESPYGPFIAQRDVRSTLQHQGHAKLVETPNGEWWALYLLQRRIRGFSPLGRETGIDPVHWTDDGWPLLNHGKGPSAENTITLPAAGTSPPTGSVADKWLTIRSPINPADRLVDHTTNVIELRCGEGSLASINPGSVMLQRETSHQFSAVVGVRSSSGGSQEAGLTCYYDTTSYLSFALSGVGDTRRIALRTCIRGIHSLVMSESIPGHERVLLRVRVHGLQRTFSISDRHNNWRDVFTIEDASFLSDEGTSQWGFTGTLVGIFAMNNGSPGRPIAIFSEFAIHNENEQEPVTPVLPQA